jgi:hypothetical protein
MRKFYALLSREVRSYFHSPIAYIVLIFFLIISGIDFYFQVSFMNQRQVQYTVQEAFFNSVFFWFAFVLIFPLITMRLFAEEFKLGTIEPLTTVPVRDWQLSQSYERAGCAFCGSLLRLLSNAPVARNVLPFDWLSDIRSDPEPDHCSDHFLLRHYAAVFPGPGSIHSAGCEF